MSAAEEMLNGESCESCGEWLFDDDGEPKDGEGIPDYCSPECASDRGADWWLKSHKYKRVNGKWIIRR
jgi:hypothetical protein